jgi:hypothetical protein
VNYVIASKKHLASIDHGVKAARHQARKNGREQVTYADIMLGFNNTVLPSDAALAAAAQGSGALSMKSRRNPIASRLHEPSKTISTPISERETRSSLAVPPARSSRHSDNDASLSST